MIPSQGTTRSDEHGDADLLTGEDLQVAIDGIPILHGVSLRVQRSEVTVMLGRNGAGKTTTLRTLMGLTKPQSGDIRFRARDITAWRSFERARGGIGYVPENRGIFPDLNVTDNLLIAERQRGDLRNRSPYIESLFPDLRRLKDMPAGQLSGGQQQMLSIARVLVPDNELLLVDEPFEGLAPVIVDQLLDTFSEIARDKTILIVEQNFRAAAEIASRYVLLSDGRSSGEGLVTDLMKDEKGLERFLGVAA